MRTTGTAASVRPAGRSLQERPGRQWHEHHLDVPEHGREPGSDGGDRVVPEDEVGAEEDARDERGSSARRSSGP